MTGRWRKERKRLFLWILSCPPDRFALEEKADSWKKDSYCLLLLGLNGGNGFGRGMLNFRIFMIHHFQQDAEGDIAADFSENLDNLERQHRAGVFQHTGKGRYGFGNLVGAKRFDSTDAHPVVFIMVSREQVRHNGGL